MTFTLWLVLGYLAIIAIFAGIDLYVDEHRPQVDEFGVWQMGAEAVEDARRHLDAGRAESARERLERALIHVDRVIG